MQGLRKIFRALAAFVFTVVSCWLFIDAAVNGPGEAHDSQLGITFGRGVGMIFKDGVPMRKVAGEDIVEAFVKETEKLLAEGAAAKSDVRHELVTIT